MKGFTYYLNKGEKYGYNNQIMVDFKEQKYKEIAINWCKQNELKYK